VLHEAAFARIEARERGALVAGARGRTWDLRHGTVPDGPVDTVVSAFVLCSVPDLEATLAAVHGALDAEGSLLFLEHIVGRVALTAAAQRAASPVWARLAGGCRLDRDTIWALRAAGFVITDCERLAPRGRLTAGTVVRGRAILRRGT
jgi:methyltransferase family protein